MSLISDFLTDCFDATEADFGIVAFVYGALSINGTLSVVTDEKELGPGGFERNIRANFATTAERFDTVFSSPELAIGKTPTVGGKLYRVERVEYDPGIVNIGLISPKQAK